MVTNFDTFVRKKIKMCIRDRFEIRPIRFEYSLLLMNNTVFPNVVKSRKEGFFNIGNQKVSRMT